MYGHNDTLSLSCTESYKDGKIVSIFCGEVDKPESSRFTGQTVIMDTATPASFVMSETTQNPDNNTTKKLSLNCGRECLRKRRIEKMKAQNTTNAMRNKREIESLVQHLSTITSNANNVPRLAAENRSKY